MACSSRRRNSDAICRSLVLTVFRRASVGWAVNVGSMKTSERIDCTSAGSAPWSAKVWIPAAMPSGTGPSWLAIRRARTRWRSSARFASIKRVVSALATVRAVASSPSERRRRNSERSSRSPRRYSALARPISSIVSTAAGDASAARMVSRIVNRSSRSSSRVRGWVAISVLTLYPPPGLILTFRSRGAPNAFPDRYGLLWYGPLRG